MWRCRRGEAVRGTIYEQKENENTEVHLKLASLGGGRIDVCGVVLGGAIHE